jgi:hypothetical protein
VPAHLLIDMIYVKPARMELSQPVFIQGPATRTSGPCIFAAMDGSTRTIDPAKVQLVMRAAAKLAARGTPATGLDWAQELQ